ncbi:hypothetical protein L596_000997 [Steinernema carpocapsae]|uniref:Uncharacterized protein n=1 Tax=Steinernema carpocapsae TaxID=34508 RepID=A0A4U8UM40_STECR|nr:hypothetical protein L596_000997 [Steinernema carpocapsae]
MLCFERAKFNESIISMQKQPNQTECSFYPVFAANSGTEGLLCFLLASSVVELWDSGKRRRANTPKGWHAAEARK